MSITQGAHPSFLAASSPIRNCLGGEQGKSLEVAVSRDVSVTFEST